MTKKIKSDNIYKYADLELCELDVLNEVRCHLQEMYDLKDRSGVSGADIDNALEKMKKAYNEMLDLARKGKY